MGKTSSRRDNIKDAADIPTLIIAHRLKTLLHMDRILVFNQGKIIQDGSHKALVSIGGIYKNLWNK